MGFLVNEKENRVFCQIRDEVFSLRYNGDLEGALQSAEKGIADFESDNLFYKLKGDILWQKGDYGGAAECYLQYLGHLNGHAEYFKNFVKFWKKYHHMVNDTADYKKCIIFHFNHLEYDLDIRREIAAFFLGNEKGNDSIIDPLIEKSTQDASNWVSEMEKAHIWEVYGVLYGLHEKIRAGRLNAKNGGVWHNAFYFVSVMEKYELYMLGAQTARYILERHDDQVELRTMFRLCRKINDYSIADEYLDLFPEKKERESFNIQYELFYYYLHKNDEEHLLQTLKRIRSSSANSIPISRTLFNFYVRLGMIDEAAAIRTQIERLKESRNEPSSKQSLRRREEEESENEVWGIIKDMATEQEHNRQMTAIYELLRGFSHELGQPMTNIRYGIQLYQMEHGQDVDSDVESLLNGILKQTVRIKDLLQRFAPIVSGKSKEDWFECKKVIDSVFEDLKFRLSNDDINYRIEGEDGIRVFGDRIQFSQIFYNLILNASDAMRNQEAVRIIDVKIYRTEDGCRIFFSDSGPGIDQSIRNKVFTPFFSTKDKENADGGSGLGLYIVWNVLKIFNGSIRINGKYKKGAQFIINLSKGDEDVSDFISRG